MKILESVRTSFPPSHIISLSLPFFRNSSSLVPQTTHTPGLSVLDNPQRHFNTAALPTTSSSSTPLTLQQSYNRHPPRHHFLHLSTLISIQLSDTMPAIKKVAMASPTKVNAIKATLERAQRSRKELAQRIETKPKPVVAVPAKGKIIKKNPPLSSLFHKPTRPSLFAPHANSNGIDVYSNASTYNVDKGYDLVRPSANTKSYKMTEKHSLRSSGSKGYASVTITRTARMPALLIAPRAEEKSCLKKPELLAEWMAEQALKENVIPKEAL
ncbi:hypothetical protein EDD36DRAFT_219748 [Exophiala viscosa]|uniref:Uncharacterized protein n=1 Tax=Exophiala viscosa TaxID=2486360 RepID=A0AAN6DXV4_9EURO|nr:hypothetical protein EDD36DRAFT_219748 [Exophiala viscosa]